MKSALLLLLGIFFTVSTFAQGTVNFANTTTTRITTNSQQFPPPGQLPNQTGFTTGAGQYTFGLYIAPLGTTDPSVFSLVGPTAVNGPLAGLFNGNPSGSFFALPGNTGQPIAFQVRAWQTSGGATYEQAFGCCGVYVGSSAIGSVTPAIGVQLTPNLFGTGAGQVSGFPLCANPFLPCGVPEPSSAMLMLIGAAAGAGILRLRFRPRR